MQTLRLIAIALQVAIIGMAAAQSREVESGLRVNAERDAYFGDLHLHTMYSTDGYISFGARLDPDGAYRFARGESVMHLDGAIKRSTPPLDFMAVTDHAEWLGVAQTLEDPNSPLSRSEVGKELRQKDYSTLRKRYAAKEKELFPGVDAESLFRSAWQRTIEAANRHYEPGKFTTFIAYEWSSHPGATLHRNVIFRDDKAPLPFTALDSVKPEDLWTFLDSCRKRGYEALAIPHNPNSSNGLAFDWINSEGRPIDQAYAEQRASNEPLVEIVQNKGASETHPSLSPKDEFSSFEIFDTYFGWGPKTYQPSGGYVRDALGRGLTLSRRAGGVNPYKYGFVGGSDFHNSLSDSAENAFGGWFGAIDPAKEMPSIEQEAEGSIQPGRRADYVKDVYKTSSGALTGVWAESNTRESIYAALRRKETFATSGTRLKFRFFGGWTFDAALFDRQNWVRAAYNAGVPMGGDLSPRPEGKKAPQFALYAAKDPDGANLDRLQIVKVWLKDGKHVERIYDVALSNGRKVNEKSGKAPAVGNTVDVAKATYTNTIGAIELKALWRDPHFDTKASAVYYLRVLEIPTPRWTTIAAVKQGKPLPDHVPASIQERGWSSPIWYIPRTQSQ
jgi:hypothetical protein